MTLQEAIEILIEDTQHPTAGFMPKLRDAELLLIEAGKRVDDYRTQPPTDLWELLPGETSN